MARSTTTPKAERVRKTPAEKAQHVLDVEQRKLDALTAKRDKATAEATALAPQIAASEARMKYLAASPDLPQPVIDADPDADAVTELDPEGVAPGTNADSTVTM